MRSRGKLETEREREREEEREVVEEGNRPDRSRID